MPIVIGTQGLKLRRRPAVVAGPSYDAETVAWAGAVVTAGGTVSDTQKGYVDTLIKALKAHSIWTIQDRIWLHASESTQQAAIDIVNLGVATPHGSPTFTASQGYTGDTTAAYIDTGFSSGSNYAQSSGSVSSYVRSSRSGGDWASVGAFDSAGSTMQTLIVPRDPFNLIVYDVNSTAGWNNASNSASQGFWTASRVGSDVSVYKNSSSTATATDNTSPNIATPSINFYILARNNAGTADRISGDQIAITTIGAGMSGAQSAQFQTDLNAYMTSLGTNVY